MKPTDLRIGNLVLNRSGEIVEFDHYMFKPFETALAEGEQMYRPVPITDEILTAMGWALCAYEDASWFEYALNGQILFETGDKNGFTEVIALPDLFPVRLQFVHQIQNFFFALTGTELPIDLDKLNQPTATNGKDKINS